MYNSHEDSSSKKQEKRVLHQVCMYPHEPGQFRVIIGQILYPLLSCLKHGVEATEWPAAQGWFYPAPQEHAGTCGGGKEGSGLEGNHIRKMNHNLGMTC